MLHQNAKTTRTSSIALSIVIFVLAVALMGWLRLHLFSKEFVSLTYGLPLLVCLWHRDKNLLWAMAGTFVAMSGYKAVFLLPDTEESNLFKALQWIMQVVNIFVIAGVVHTIVNLTDRLKVKNQLLEIANEELAAKAEEISRQNEELESQSEELLQQNEEIQAQSEELSQQNEELQQQAEELQTQTEELQSLHSEIRQREMMLQSLLESVNLRGDDQPVLQRICQLVVGLFGDPITAAGVMAIDEGQITIISQVGLCEESSGSLPYGETISGIVLEYDQTASIDDLSLRPDLKVPTVLEGQIRSALSTPLRLDGKPIATLEIFSTTPQRWTRKHYQMLEWVAAQCALNMEARQLRQALADSNTNLEEVVQERTAKLQEMVNELEHFSYTITHDMRAPLRAMQGYAGMLQEECQEIRDLDCKEYLDRIIASAGRMDRLITDALSYSRAVQQQVALTPVDTGKLLRGMIDSYPMFQPPHVELVMLDRLPIVLGNEAGLTQCLSNLLSNAIKFVGPGQQPHVTIRLEKRGDRARIWFEDKGIGIAPHMISRIFGMFQRASKEYEGTGIGLALVRKVTERMGGEVGVESELGKGSRFWIELKSCY